MSAMSGTDGEREGVIATFVERLPTVISGKINSGEVVSGLLTTILEITFQENSSL